MSIGRLGKRASKQRMGEGGVMRASKYLGPKTSQAWSMQGIDKV